MRLDIEIEKRYDDLNDPNRRSDYFCTPVAIHIPCSVTFLNSEVHIYDVINDHKKEVTDHRTFNIAGIAKDLVIRAAFPFSCIVRASVKARTHFELGRLVSDFYQQIYEEEFEFMKYLDNPIYGIYGYKLRDLRVTDMYVCMDNTVTLNITV